MTASHAQSNPRIRPPLLPLAAVLAALGSTASATLLVWDGETGSPLWDAVDSGSGGTDTNWDPDN